MALAAGANPYDIQRQRINQQAQNDVQNQQGAIQRRFAAMGNLNSGSAIKAQQIAQDQANQARDTNLSGVDAAEAQHNEAIQEAQKGRDFQAQQAQLGRDFSAGEAEKGRKFQAGQSDIDRAFQNKVFDTNQGNKLREMDLQERQFQHTLNDDAFNRKMELYNAFGKGGLFGIGAWNADQAGFGDEPAVQAQHAQQQAIIDRLSKWGK